MAREFILAADDHDLSGGFDEFFKTIAASGGGILVKATAAVLVVVAIGMAFKAINNPKMALRKGMMAVGTLFVAIILGLYGSTIFSSVTNNAPKGSQQAPNNPKG
ncbi:hypothetical protein ACIBEA_41785 [Streptomyces sp. NPDC051555]|uniref:hypothetical protein n=1 Tax=Streptomyces sp. NPDC051555 TaxID=3365657 RepID=UPI0037BBFE5C